MVQVSCVAVYAAAVLYLAAAVWAVWYARPSAGRGYGWVVALIVAGMIGLAVSFGVRWATWGRTPLTTMSDSLNVFVFLASGVAISRLRGPALRSVLAVCLPILSILMILAAGFARVHFSTAPRALPSAPLLIHVGLAFLAYALFFVAGGLGVVYIYQAHQLKKGSADALIRPLASLELLDHALSRLVAAGYATFAITVMLGLLWAHLDRELLSDRWWMAPKVWLSWVTLVLYAVTYHGRKMGRLRGPKLALMVCWGFAAVLTAYLVLSMLDYDTHNFWSGAV